MDNNQSIPNYQRMLLRNALKAFDDTDNEEPEKIEDYEHKIQLSLHQAETYKQMNVEVENKPRAMFSKRPKTFLPEDFFDETGNETTDNSDLRYEAEEKLEEANTKEIENETKCNCLLCTHFYVTYDKKFPRGCRKYNFISDMIPSEVVNRYLGTECEHYSYKFSKKFAKLLESKMFKP